MVKHVSQLFTNLEFSFWIAERNLNPKAACLKRREEEKSDGSKLPPPHLPHPSSMAPPFPNLPVSTDYNITFSSYL